MADQQSTPEPPKPGPSSKPEPHREPEPMTRDRAIELLKTDVDAWSKWRYDVDTWNGWNPATLVELPDLSKADLPGAHLKEADLSGVHLEGAKLMAAHLEEADLNCAHLEGANLYGAHLEGADLGNAHLEEANLRDAHLEGADLLAAHLEGADLSGADLERAKLHEAHLEGADLSGADFSNANVTGVTYDRRRGKFRGIRVATCYGHALFVRDARDQDYIETFRAQSWWHAILWLFWAFFTDCGRSLLRVGLIGASVAVFFGWVYEKNPALLDMSDSAQTPWTPFYYSIVTFTTLGFGDVTPASFEGELWVGAEVLAGYLMLGLLVSILANKVARRA